MGVTTQPVVTVAIVSDYRGGAEQSWDDLRRTLAALAKQDFENPVEYLLLENRDDLQTMPADVREALPGVRIVPSDTPGSYEMKNLGAREASAELVMLLDADCTPEPGWIRAGVAIMKENPDVVAASGRTVYPGRSTLERSLGLLARSFVDRGSAGEIGLLSTNNMIARRAELTSDELPEGAGPFAYRILTERWRRRGGKLYFEPRMKVTHQFEGLAMERDLRRQVGWTSIRIRQLDSSIPGAFVVRRLGTASVPLFYVYRVAESIGRSFRLTRPFGLRWWHTPLLAGLALRVHGFEIPGMLAAIRGQEPGPSAYR